MPGGPAGKGFDSSFEARSQYVSDNCLVDVSDLFFSARGRGRWSPKCQEGRGGRFFY